MNQEGAFDSAWRKWQRAGVHVKELQEAVYGDGNPKQLVMPEVVSQYEPKRHAIVLRVSRVEHPPHDWAPRLGDVVANFHDALDHVAWAIVQRGSRGGSLSPSEESGVYFPYATTDRDFSKIVKRKLPGGRRADVAIVRRYQPYKRGRRNLARHVLTVLNECSKFDKHRELRSVPIRPGQSMLTIGRIEDCVVTRVPALVRTTTMEPDAEVGRVYVRKTGPNPRAYMNGRFGLDVSIEDKVWLWSWLNETQRFIGCLLAEFSEPPRDVLYIPANTFPPGWFDGPTHGASP